MAPANKYAHLTKAQLLQEMMNTLDRMKRLVDQFPTLKLSPLNLTQSSAATSSPQTQPLGATKDVQAVDGMNKPEIYTNAVQDVAEFSNPIEDDGFQTELEGVELAQVDETSPDLQFAPLPEMCHSSASLELPRKLDQTADEDSDGLPDLPTIVDNPAVVPHGLPSDSDVVKRDLLSNTSGDLVHIQLFPFTAHNVLSKTFVKDAIFSDTGWDLARCDDFELGGGSLDYFSPLQDALKVCDPIADKLDILYNTSLTGYTRFATFKQDMRFIDTMRCDGLVPLVYHFEYLLKICGTESERGLGKATRGLRVINGYASVLFAFNIVANMYVQCLMAEDAYKMFDKMSERNLTSKNIVISGNAEIKTLKIVLELVLIMHEEWVRLDWITMVSVLPTTADFGSLDISKLIHGVTVRGRFEKNIYVIAALADMYAICGVVDTARKFFVMTEERHLITWNAMIVGYRPHGQGKATTELFEEMLSGLVISNWITFLCGITEFKGCLTEHSLFVKDEVIPLIYQSTVFPYAHLSDEDDQLFGIHHVAFMNGIEGSDHDTRSRIAECDTRREYGCYVIELLADFDDAISDGVHICSCLHGFKLAETKNQTQNRWIWQKDKSQDDKGFERFLDTGQCGSTTVKLALVSLQLGVNKLFALLDLSNLAADKFRGGFFLPGRLTKLVVRNNNGKINDSFAKRDNVAGVRLSVVGGLKGKENVEQQDETFTATYGVNVSYSEVGMGEIQLSKSSDIVLVGCTLMELFCKDKLADIYAQTREYIFPPGKRVLGIDIGIADYDDLRLRGTTKAQGYANVFKRGFPLHMRMNT